MNEINSEFMYQTFKHLGLNINEIEQEGMELGGEEWMEIMFYITGKDAYDDDVFFTEEDDALMQEFTNVMEENGIGLW